MNDNEQVVEPQSDDAAAAPAEVGTDVVGDVGGDAEAEAADGGADAGADVAAGAGGAAGAGVPTEDGGATDGGAARRPRREKPRRDPHEPTYGGLFLDALQRAAGLRGQFAYGAPALLWHANREVLIRILREDVPMATFKNQIQCILHEDPELLAQDVHYEMLTSAVPPEDSFRWLWLFMMLR